MAQRVKRLPARQEICVRFLGWEDPLERAIATHSSILAWKIPWTEEPGAGYSPWGHKETNTTERLHFCIWGEVGAKAWPGPQGDVGRSRVRAVRPTLPPAL